MGNRYCKVNKDKSTRFTTRLVSKKAINSYNEELYKRENIDLLQKAGFLERKNCIPLVVKHQSSKNSKAGADFKNIGALKSIFLIEKPKQLPVQNIDIVTPVILRENLLLYKDYPNLIALPIGSVHNVDGWGFVKHYGTERLVLSLD